MHASPRDAGRPVRGSRRGPGIPGAERLDLSTPVGMLAAAQAQTAHFKTIDPAAPIGGDLIVYEIMKGGIILREMGAI